MNSNSVRADLIAHWPLTEDFRCLGNDSLSIVNHNVELGSEGNEGSRAAQFNGSDSYLEVAAHSSLDWNRDDFSVAMWIETDGNTDVVGDLVSRFDSATRRGWALNVVTNTGVTSVGQANYRQLHFGIDNGTEGVSWQDCGRPGNATFIYSLAAIHGRLYAGTFEIEADGQGHLWRYEGNGQWHDCGGTPDGSNGIPSIVAYEGQLYCCTGRYNPEGSRLGPPRNTAPGGRLYRVDENDVWHDCGLPGSEGAVPENTPTSGYETGKADETCGLTVFRGKLYATSFHRRGVFVYEGGTEWKYAGLNERLMTFTVYRDNLYALINGGPLFRYDGGEDWTYCGIPNGSTQTYAAATYRGELLVGTWPECELVRYDGGEDWTTLGRVGYEREVMAMALYNSKVYFGTLPMANVWRLDDNDYTYIGNLDNSPEYYLRRVWSMAVHDGKLFAGTLPAGRVLSYQAGRMATYDETLPVGRHHIAAVRDGNVLRLYLDGREVAQSATFDPADYDLTTTENLKIGIGPHQYFHGSMSDLRLYRGALEPHEVKRLSEGAANSGSVEGMQAGAVPVAETVG